MKHKAYYTNNEIADMFDNLSPIRKAQVLYTALDFMEQYNGRSKFMCIAMALGFDNPSGEKDKYIKES